jgi:hypothetical protein
MSCQRIARSEQRGAIHAASFSTRTAQRCFYLRTTVRVHAQYLVGTEIAVVPNMITFYKILSPGSRHAVRVLGITALTFMLIDLASGHSTPSSSVASELPRASLQEVMDAIVDPAADGLWDAVETTVAANGEHTRTPQTDADWADVRRKLIVLRESASLLRLAGRPVSHKAFVAEADGALNSWQIAARIRRDRAVFDAFATALGVTAQRALQAVEARDTDAMIRIGGDLDGVCEACHSHFWYPNQVIPPVP